MDLKKHIGIALAYFLAVALMGILLRFYFVVSLPFNFKFLLHAHSHTALLGWIYLGLTTLIYKIFLSEAQKPKLYKRIFIFTNVCIVGMMITFPFQGYALFSIIFSTLFLFASYWFSWFAMNHIPAHFKTRFSWKLIKASLWYLVLSSIGPWTIGGVMATLGPESIWYKTSIYFYLHFQYNGWFILALLGVVFYVFEEKGIQFNPQKLKSFFLLLNFGVLFTVFLSVLWFVPPTVFYVLGLIGAVAQCLAFFELFLLLKDHFPVLKKVFTPRAFFLLKIAGGLVLVKLLMQLFSAFPYIANLAFLLKDFVIGYLHLVFLGIVITTMLAFLQYFKLILLPKSFISIFLVAFVTTEFLIFYKAFAVWLGLPFFQDYYICLAVLSCLFPVAVGILFFKNLKSRSS
ncbi:hypothetical protein Aeqsu_0121 [Aequorivita sublithincola DSM 14238]|uniref:Uncharacterized protein n=1 Tax=Aequorivita sublithincola (strain DSM 14238 / LMG 21431 / ACAM 643 / 9-3) TaxID=746697 RepID=I3YRN2_AEQSU|nr:hypothetical protein [Aequorivita sublithincola]AFL79650.1 hypothetical protein Aeqsu_0121 [Aequorivita sublithincola DSM 14238]